jgi:di/tricarboxylate transporter
MGPVSRGERIVGAVFLCTAAAWIFRTPKELGSVVIPGITTWAPWVQDSTIAMAAAILLFSIPLDRRRSIMQKRLPTAERRSRRCSRPAAGVRRLKACAMRSGC